MTEQVRGQGAAAQAYFVYTKPSQRRHSCLLRLFWRVFSCVSRPNVAVFVHVNRRRVLRKLDLDAVFRCRAAKRLGHGVGLKCDRCAHVDLHDEVYVRDAYRSDIHRELAALDIGLRAACAVGCVIGHVYAGDALYPAQLPKGALHFFVVHFILPAALPADGGSMR